jgi:hypothetical protein
MRFVPQIFRIIDVEDIMVERGNDDRAGNGGGKGGDDPGGERLVLELPEKQIEQIGGTDAENGNDSLAPASRRSTPAASGQSCRKTRIRGSTGWLPDVRPTACGFPVQIFSYAFNSWFRFSLGQYGINCL